MGSCKSLKRLERETGLEPATSSLGILFRCKQRTYAPKAMITGNLRPQSFRHLQGSGSLTQ
jgi:hypothetical protein